MAFLLKWANKSVYEEKCLLPAHMKNYWLNSTQLNDENGKTSEFLVFRLLQFWKHTQIHNYTHSQLVSVIFLAFFEIEMIAEWNKYVTYVLLLFIRHKSQLYWTYKLITSSTSYVNCTEHGSFSRVSYAKFVK